VKTGRSLFWKTTQGKEALWEIGLLGRKGEGIIENEGARKRGFKGKGERVAPTRPIFLAGGRRGGVPRAGFVRGRGARRKRT